MSPQLLANKHNRLRDSRLSLIRPSGGLRLVAEKSTGKKKTRVDYEPRSAHGGAVNKQLLDSVFVISGKFKVEVGVISETLIIPDITKTECNNNCFIIILF